MAVFGVYQRQRFREIGENEAHLLGVGPPGEGVELRTAHLAGGDKLCRAGDFGRALDAADAAADGTKLAGHRLSYHLARTRNMEQGTIPQVTPVPCSLFHVPLSLAVLSTARFA